MAEPAKPQPAPAPSRSAPAAEAQAPRRDSSLPEQLIAGGTHLRPSNVLSLQRTIGNAAIVRQMRMTPSAQSDIQRWPPGSPNFTPAQNASSASGAGQQPITIATADAAYRRARAIVDHTPTPQLPAVRHQIEQAIDQHGHVNTVISLTLGTETVDGFPSDRLQDLFGATDLGSRRNFERAQQQEARTQEQAAAARRLEQARLEAMRQRVATENHLRSLDNPSAGPNGTYQVLSPDGRTINITQQQMDQLRRAAWSSIRTLVNQAQNHLASAGDTAAFANNSLILVPNAGAEELGQHGGANESLAAAIRQLGLGTGQAHDTGSLLTAFSSATAAVESAVAAERATLARTQDTTNLENVIYVLRAVRDACIAIDGTLLTIATGGGMGAIVLGSAASSVAGGAAAAEDQYLDTGRVNWGEIVTGAVVSTVVGSIGNRLNPTLTSALQQGITRNLIRVLAQPSMRATLSAQTRLTLVHAIETHVVPRVTSMVVGRAGGAAGAIINGVAVGQSEAQITQALRDQVNWRSLITEALNTEANVSGPRVNGAPQQHNF